MSEAAVVETNLPGLKLAWRGKVRDVYDLGDKLLIVSTDRISAFDFILATPVPGKGRLLNRLSAWWFKTLEALGPNHLLTAETSELPRELAAHAAVLDGRAMLARKAKRVDVECVVRGYLAGAGLKAYRETGGLWGRPLPTGLREAERLPRPVFTPTTKAHGGAHDEPLGPEGLDRLVGAAVAKRLEAASLELYERAAAHCASRGLLLADTKFEFGREGDALVWIDEALTPDSSRFWDAATWRPGRTPDNFDKQFVRDHLERSGWNKQAPAPGLPPDVVEKTLERYREVLRRVAG